jgi:outer membrane PBP1 activator LpoA protein
MSESTCPHCHLPAVLPDVCTPEIRDVQNAQIARDGELYEAGYFAAQPMLTEAEQQRIAAIQARVEQRQLIHGDDHPWNVDTSWLLALVQRLTQQEA